MESTNNSLQCVKVRSSLACGENIKKRVDKVATISYNIVKCKSGNCESMK